MKAKRRQRRLLTYLLLGGVGLVALALTAFIYINNTANSPPAVGEEIPIMASIDHVPDGTDPGPYNSDPPTSGRHYATSQPPGFYQAADAAGLGEYPEGYLVHSLEHGHVIFWYNCSILSQEACTELQDQIQNTMDGFPGYKLIAFPRESLDVPVAMTSWGKLQRFETFDMQLASDFIRANHNQAPEPWAQ